MKDKKSLKVVILAGGIGSRISEESFARPKPMIEIGGKPILLHIMRLYSAYGLNDFIICCGYRGYMIKEYFANYFLHMSDVTFHMRENKMEVHQRHVEPWRVTLIDTGENTLTGGRLKKVKPYVEDEEFFCFTYGDGLSDINLQAQIKFHKEHRKLATVTAVQPPGRYGALDLGAINNVQAFIEKPLGEGGWINGGFFILSPEVIKYIEGDDTSWETTPLGAIAADGELMAYRHFGFWHAMDTLRDKNYLEELWLKDKAPWRINNQVVRAKETIFA